MTENSEKVDMSDFPVHDHTQEQNGSPYFSSIVRQSKWPSLSRKIVVIQKFCYNGNLTSPFSSLLLVFLCLKNKYVIGVVIAFCAEIIEDWDVTSKKKITLCSIFRLCGLCPPVEKMTFLIGRLKLVRCSLLVVISLVAKPKLLLQKKNQWTVGTRLGR